jgi:FlaA1/EpsC-like NDP-sugar epimerase
MVTGAAGSIGSEIVRQLIFFEVEKIIAVEVDETEVFNRELEVQKIKRDNQEIVFIIGDIREEQKMETVFDAYHPEIVFHAAAYKHVPLMERFPEEAVKTNVLGTFSLANLAVKFGVKKFINISTDKAVNPTSVMGASKRLAEIICRGMNGSESRFISVRFGNVLGSRGSVIPLFLKQIEEGGPLTVTHPDMQRYFMSEKEAVILVFQATLMGEGGEVFVLDMGEPVKIKQMAETLIRLNNLVPYEDIDIVFSGLRPGEKLFEELLTAEEGTDLTTHEKIYIAKNSSNYDSDKIAGLMAQLKRTIPDGEKLIKFLKQNVPYYH